MKEVLRVKAISLQVRKSDKSR